MNQKTTQDFFALLRTAISNEMLTEAEKENFSSGDLPRMIAVSQKHDIGHMLALGLTRNGMLSKENSRIAQQSLLAAYRYEHSRFALEKLCQMLEEAKIPFLPLKGTVLCKYYPEPWMRTSSDIDVLVRKGDLDYAKKVLLEKGGYTYQGSGAHDISFFTENKVSIELHYSLIEEGRVKNAAKVLNTVWETAVVREGYSYWHEMSDELFYFYHVSHMAKHIKNGGCGIRPFIDLWFLENDACANRAKRATLIARGGLKEFCKAAVKLSNAWFGGKEKDEVTQSMEAFILHGGLFGTKHQALLMTAAEGESKVKNFLNIVFLSPSALAETYPNIKKYPILFPFYQILRWFRFLDTKKRAEIKSLLKERRNISKGEIASAVELLSVLGLGKRQ